MCGKYNFEVSFKESESQAAACVSANSSAIEHCLALTPDSSCECFWELAEKSVKAEALRCELLIETEFILACTALFTRRLQQLTQVHRWNVIPKNGTKSQKWLTGKDLVPDHGASWYIRHFLFLRVLILLTSLLSLNANWSMNFPNPCFTCSKSKKNNLSQRRRKQQNYRQKAEGIKIFCDFKNAKQGQRCHGCLISQMMKNKNTWPEHIQWQFKRLLLITQWKTGVIQIVMALEGVNYIWLSHLFHVLYHSLQTKLQRRRHHHWAALEHVTAKPGKMIWITKWNTTM